MDRALVTTGTVILPTLLLIIVFRLKGRRVELPPLLWAGCACLVYFLLLRSRSVIPVPAFMEELTLNWVGKTLSLVATITMLYLFPKVSFRAAGLTWMQNKGSLRPVIAMGAVLLFSTAVAVMLIAPSPDSSLENILFQATLPGLDEELFMRGLLLLLFHQAFGKGLNILGAETGWGFWLAVAIFGLIHGITIQSGELAVNIWAIMATGLIGFILTWMRERTGSLVVPIVFHNSWNITLALV